MSIEKGVNGVRPHFPEMGSDPFFFGKRRAEYLRIDAANAGTGGIDDDELAALEFVDLAYRGLCAMLYNFVPGSGHPGGSISTGRISERLLFHTMDYDLANPELQSADTVVYSAGHKALGLYSLWALRNEIARITQPELLPANVNFQFRLEDLLGFRRNPTADTPLFRGLGVHALDGHPTPSTPFLKVATGASGVGFCSAIGLGLGAFDLYRADAPKVHILEGEGGMTPGRVAEAMAAAGTMGLGNVILHVDFNQASIDSGRVCRDESGPGDYVQWDPAELAWLHDWNVIQVEDGKDFAQVAAAQAAAARFANGQPTAIVYRTVKGWQYGIEGRESHGSGHKMCSPGFMTSIREVPGLDLAKLAECGTDGLQCAGKDPAAIEACYWKMLSELRSTLEANKVLLAPIGAKLVAARDRLAQRQLVPRPQAPRVEALHDAALVNPLETPEALCLKAGSKATPRS